jgi:HAD superfamily hydrolase (TIGR01484 family)
LNQVIQEIRVEGLFLDYDGTISPLNVTREKSAVPQETAVILQSIKQIIPVGVLTTKDMSFICQRTPFASAWCAIGGLEIKIGEKLITDERVQKALPYISMALRYARENGGKQLFIEEKQSLKGQTLAFCVDWRQANNPKQAKTTADNIFDYCLRLHLNAVKYEEQPFIDVYPCAIDKGEALAEMKKHLGLTKGIMYFGDSKVDNPAFNTAEISVGVLHEETHANLTCDYYVKFEDVAGLLHHLKANAMVFSRNFPEILSERMGKEKK